MIVINKGNKLKYEPKKGIAKGSSNHWSGLLKSSIKKKDWPESRILSPKTSKTAIKIGTCIKKPNKPLMVKNGLILFSL